MPPSNNNTSMLLGAGVYSVSCCSARSRRLQWLRLWCLLPDLLTSALWIHCSFWVSGSDVPRLPLWKSGHRTQEPLHAFTLSFLHFCQSSHSLGALNRVHFPWPDDAWNFSSFQYDLSLAAVVCHAVQWFPFFEPVLECLVWILGVLLLLIPPTMSVSKIAIFQELDLKQPYASTFQYVVFVFW